MRAVIQLLFIVFYVGSSCVTTQHRLTQIVHKLDHANSCDNHCSLESCNEGIHYPHFREAKKAVTDFNFGADATPKVSQIVSTRPFTPQTISVKSQIEVEVSQSRPPPPEAGV
jgi:hypothetical protein